MHGVTVMSTILWSDASVRLNALHAVVTFRVGDSVTAIDVVALLLSVTIVDVGTIVAAGLIARTRCHAVISPAVSRPGLIDHRRVFSERAFMHRTAGFFFIVRGGDVVSHYAAHARDGRRRCC